MSPRLAPLVFTLALATPGGARAHGTIPTSNSIGFTASGGVFLGTNFGGVHHADDGDTFTCELAVTGTQQALDVWLQMKSRALAAASTTSGFTRGVMLSDEAGCVFSAVDGTAELLISDLTLEPGGEGFYATGVDLDAVLVRGDAAGSVTLHTAAGAEAMGVRAAGEDVVAVFMRGAEAEVVHLADGDKTVATHTLAEGETLRPLGFAAGEGGPVAWFVRRGPEADVLVTSLDFGVTLTEVGSLAARVGGFAEVDGVVYLQSPQLGVHRFDGALEALAGSPHGACLVAGPDRALWACGVPWQDGFALGRSEDGRTFAPVIASWDRLVGARACSDAPEVSSTCEGELDFLRGYYGFDDPTVAEPGPEVAEVEPGPELPEGVEVIEVVEAEVSERAPGPRDDGCASGPGSLVGVALLGLVALSRRRPAP